MVNHQLIDLQSRSPPGGARRLGAGLAASLIVHSALFLALIWVPVRPLAPPDLGPVTVALMQAPPMVAPLAPPAPPLRAREEPTRPPRKARQTPKPRIAPSPIAAQPLPAPPMPELTPAEVATAATASSGSPGRACDMIQFLQAALRKDRAVEAALVRAGRSGGATLVWNGAWIRSPGEDGEGLAIVREAVMIEVAFAPEGCRADPVRGLVLISLGDAPGSPRLAIGRGEWRWSDLLFPG